MKKIFAVILATVLIALPLSVSAATPGIKIYYSEIREVAHYEGDGESSYEQYEYENPLDSETREAVFDAIHKALYNVEDSVYLADFAIPVEAVGNTLFSEAFDIFNDVTSYCYDIPFTNQYICSYYLEGINIYIYDLMFNGTLEGTSNTVTPEGYTKAEQARRRVFNNNEIKKIISGIPKTATDVQKVVYVHDYLVLNYNYDFTLKIHDVYGLLSTGKGVCQSYALTFKAIMDALNIECHTSVSDTDHHIWNIVKLNGNYYYVDCTNDDPSVDQNGTQIKSLISHDNLLLSYDELIERDNHSYPRTIPATIECNCTDGSYENTVLRSITSQIVEYGGNWYGVLDSLPRSIVRFNQDFSDCQEIKTTPKCNTTATSFSLFTTKIGSKLYITDPFNIFVYDFKTNTVSNSILRTSTISSQTGSNPNFIGTYSDNNGKINVIVLHTIEGVPKIDFTNTLGIYCNGIQIGDLNNDTQVNAYDLAVLKQYLLGMNVSVDNIEGLADLNQNNTVDILDLMRYKQYLAGSISEICG